MLRTRNQAKPQPPASCVTSVPLVMAALLFFFAARLLALVAKYSVAPRFLPSVPGGLSSSIPPTLEEQRPLVIMTTYLGVSQRAEQRNEQELKPQDLKSEATSKPLAPLRLFYLQKFKTHCPEKEDPGVLSDFHLFVISSMTPFPGGAKGPRRRPSDIGR